MARKPPAEPELGRRRPGRCGPRRCRPRWLRARRRRPVPSPPPRWPRWLRRWAGVVGGSGEAAGGGATGSGRRLTSPEPRPGGRRAGRAPAARPWVPRQSGQPRAAAARRSAATRRPGGALWPARRAARAPARAGAAGRPATGAVNPSTATRRPPARPPAWCCPALGEDLARHHRLGVVFAAVAGAADGGDPVRGVAPRRS